MTVFAGSPLATARWQPGRVTGRGNCQVRSGTPAFDASLPASSAVETASLGGSGNLPFAGRNNSANGLFDLSKRRFLIGTNSQERIGQMLAIYADLSEMRLVNV
ncbi:MULTISPECIES: hypothetical protein [Cupriavidus]